MADLGSYLILAAPPLALLALAAATILWTALSGRRRHREALVAPATRRRRPTR